MYKIVQSTEQQNTFIIIRDHGVIKSANHYEMASLLAYINEVATWCKETFGNEYETWNIDASVSAFIFEKDDEAMAFKMRWT